jgi:hypothetical protein
MSQNDNLTTLFVDLWRSFLNDAALGQDDNFFLAGGHSLAALRLIDRIAMTTGHTVSLVLLLDNPTPASLAKRLAQAGQG